jgi:hypothetical protein
MMNTLFYLLRKRSFHPGGKERNFALNMYPFMQYCVSHGVVDYQKIENFIDAAFRYDRLVRLVFGPWSSVSAPAGTKATNKKIKKLHLVTFGN